MNETAADEKDINNEIFSDYLKYKNPSVLVKDLISAKHCKNDKILNNINTRLIDLRNDINRKEILEKQNPKKVVDIVDKILDFNKQKRVKDFKT